MTFLLFTYFHPHKLLLLLLLSHYYLNCFYIKLLWLLSFSKTIITLFFIRVYYFDYCYYHTIICIICRTVWPGWLGAVSSHQPEHTVTDSKSTCRLVIGTTWLAWIAMVGLLKLPLQSEIMMVTVGHHLWTMIS